MPVLSIVAAMERNRGIGLGGRLPWNLPGDMRFFRDLTTCPNRAVVEKRFFTFSDEERPPLPVPTSESRNAVLMGRNTWESLPPAFKPLPNRFNGVLSRRGFSVGEGGPHKVWTSLKEAVADLHRDESVNGIFIIGGARIFSEALNLQDCARIYLTSIDASLSCDVFFPEIPSRFHETEASDWIEEGGIRYRFRMLKAFPSLKSE